MTEIFTPFVPLAELNRRIAEIRRDNARAAARERACPGCGCRRSARCGMIRISDDELGACAFVLGHDVCAGCLQPERRVPAEGFAPRARPRRRRAA